MWGRPLRDNPAEKKLFEERGNLIHVNYIRTYCYYLNCLYIGSALDRGCFFL